LYVINNKMHHRNPREALFRLNPGGEFVTGSKFNNNKQHMYVSMELRFPTQVLCFRQR